MEEVDEVSLAVEICKLQCSSVAVLQRTEQDDAGPFMFSMMYEVKEQAARSSSAN